MRPKREIFRQADQTYFVTFQTARRQCLFRHQSWSNLFLQILENYLPQIGLHDFVIMPDHIHLLFSPQVPLEKAVQLIRGAFSFQAKRTLQWKFDIWQAGFSDHRIRDIDDWDRHIDYLFKNTQERRSEGRAVRGATTGMNLHPLPPWLKPRSSVDSDGGAEAPPLQSMPKHLANRDDIICAKDAEDTFRKLGI